MKNISTPVLLILFFSSIMLLTGCKRHEDGKHSFHVLVIAKDMILFNQSPNFSDACEEGTVKKKIEGWWRSKCIDGSGTYYEVYTTVEVESVCINGIWQSATQVSGIEPTESNNCFKVPGSVMETLKPLIKIELEKMRHVKELGGPDTDI